MRKFVLFFCFSLLLASCANNQHEFQNHNINVVLENNESFVSNDGYTRTITFGESTSFNIVINPGYRFKSLSHGLFNNGTITLENVCEPTRIVVFTETIKKHSVKVNNDDTKGSIGDYMPLVLDGEEFTVSVEPHDDYEFLGWSLDSTLENGGKFISDRRTLIMKIEDNVELFTNYISKDQANYIYYYLNGGTMIDGSSSVFYRSVIPMFGDRIKNPNTSIGTDVFCRDGYTLYSWNTEPDGSGDDIGLGSRINSSNTTKLYAKWAKWTDANFFEFSVTNSGSVEITKCISNNQTISVPETIKGRIVKKIKANSFVGLVVNELILPKTIETIEDGAFANCASLKSLKFFDNIVSASEKAFYNTSNLSTYKINAVIEPRYNKATANAIDFLNEIETHKTIICGGSIVYTSIFANTFLAKSNDYELGICSGDISAGFRFYVELACALAKPGDIVAGVPLYWGGGIGGSGKFAVNTFQILESNFDLLQLLDARHFNAVLDSLCLFNNTRLKMNPVGYASVEPYIDARGITVEIKHNPSIDISHLQCTEKVFQDDSVAFCQYLQNMCEKKEVEFYIVPGAFINVDFNSAFFDKWNEVYPNALGNILDFEYQFEYFSNTRWHLTRQGSITFTNQITELLRGTGCFER